MIPDPRWLSILKTSGWQCAAATVASGLLLFANERQWLPVPLPDWAALAAEVALLVFGCLAVASLGLEIVRSSKPAIDHFNRWRWTRKAKRQAEAYLPHLRERDRAIIAYLLEKNETGFTTELDGGHAAGLIAHGFIVRTIKPGQVVREPRVPFTVPVEIWEILQKHKAQFPYKPQYSDGAEVRPWLVHWMER
jgi:hypothetical protein